MEIKAIATDLDGTITNRIGIINLDALKRIRLLQKNNIPVIIVSGQNIYSASTLSYYMGASNFTVAENGGVISYFFSKHTLLGSRKPAEDGLEALKSKFGNKICLTSNSHLRYRDITLQKRFNLRLAREYLENQKIEAKLLDSSYIFHILDKTISKGHGLIECIKIYNEKQNPIEPIQLNNIVSIGDAENDQDMLNVTGYSIALRHSPKSLRESADFVTTKRYGNGFCEAIDYVIKVFNLDLK
ncbi:MAG: phosphoglycolate phosphatase [Candidatus Lokiarchaeota archaeon]|nr:phosphoglycolate phosphatase [Candidatus Lokiarchaeota archaeon]